MDLLVARSDFFKKALSGEWKEATERVVNLPEEKPWIFAIYTHVLYTGTVATKPAPGFVSKGDVDENFYLCMQALWRSETAKVHTLIT